MKTIKYKEFKYKCPLYPVHYSITFTNDLMGYMFKKHGHDAIGAGAITAHKPSGGPVEVIFPLNPPVNYIGHEVAHLAQCILGLSGVKFAFDNQEPLAYLMGHVLDDTMKAYKQRSKGKWKTL